MTKLQPFTESQLERFWSCIQKGEDTDCWPSIGVSEIRIDGRKVSKKQIAIWLATGIDVGNSPIYHSCGTDSCLNPSHLTTAAVSKEKPDPTNIEIRRLQGRLQIIQDELKAAQSAVQVNDKKVTLFELLAEHMQGLITPLQPPALFELEDPAMEVQTIQEDLVMHLSDEHADETVLPHQVGGFENYNFPIALSRAENYIDTTIKFTRRTLVGYHFPRLWILAYGDHTSGEIHKSVDRSYYRNQLRNSLAIGQMHAFMFRDLAAYFPEIHVIYLPGNHGRRAVFVKKDYNNPWDSWDYLIGETAKAWCQNIPQIYFHIPDAFNVVIDINGWGFHVQHGDDIPSWNNLPWYGIERQTRRLSALHNTAGRPVHYYVMGHFHKHSTIGDLKGETIINGPWLATNPYSYGKFSSYTEPTQWIHGVHPKYGISWRMNVKLRHAEETDGPKRYKIQLANPEGDF